MIAIAMMMMMMKKMLDKLYGLLIYRHPQVQHSGVSKSYISLLSMVAATMNTPSNLIMHSISVRSLATILTATIHLKFAAKRIIFYALIH